MKKVLIITYYWPPSGGAGVQRWLKFAKYLPEFGWQPVILTVDPKYASYPQLDNSLSREIHPDCMVFTTKSFELYNLYKVFSGRKEVPYGGFANELEESFLQKVSKFLRGNFLLPDPRKGWNKYALKKAVELICQYNIETVITTSPPHSTQLIGLALKEKLKIRWISDLRDPWTDIYYYDHFRHTAIARKIDLNYERSVLENADIIINVSTDVKRIFSGKTPMAVAEKTMIIPNGFDEEDFPGKIFSQEQKKIITYTGTISESYDVSGLLDAIQKLDARAREKLVVRFVGKVPLTIVEKFSVAGISTDLVGYVDHARSIEYLYRSDLLLMIVPRVKNNKGIITGKFFEYLASGKPVLAIGPVDGDLAELIGQTECGKLFEYGDSEGMGQFIADQLDNPSFGGKRDKIESFSRRHLTGRIAALLK
jgi:glycosyltransferase involved in cell wall biosynthesis